MAYNLIGEIEVHCNNSGNGCMWDGTIAELAEHLEECIYPSNRMPKWLREHLQSVRKSQAMSTIAEEKKEDNTPPAKAQTENEPKNSLHETAALKEDTKEEVKVIIANNQENVNKDNSQSSKEDKAKPFELNYAKRLKVEARHSNELIEIPQLQSQQIDRQHKGRKSRKEIAKGGKRRKRQSQ